jgi:Trk K+ transport system NAD-binding subunit
MTNLQIALRARALNPVIQVVIRIFDDQLSEHIRQTFGYNVAVYSTSALAAPTFVAAALNQMNMHRIELDGISQAIARLQIEPAALQDISIAQLDGEENLMVLLHAHNGRVDIPPKMETPLKVGDEIVVMTNEAKVEELNQRNRVR